MDSILIGGHRKSHRGSTLVEAIEGHSRQSKMSKAQEPVIYAIHCVVLFSITFTVVLHVHCIAIIVQSCTCSLSSKLSCHSHA